VNSTFLRTGRKEDKSTEKKEIIRSDAPVSKRGFRPGREKEKGWGEKQRDVWGKKKTPVIPGELPEKCSPDFLYLKVGGGGGGRRGRGEKALIRTKKEGRITLDKSRRKKGDG